MLQWGLWGLECIPRSGEQVVRASRVRADKVRCDSTLTPIKPYLSNSQSWPYQGTAMDLGGPYREGFGGFKYVLIGVFTF